MADPNIALNFDEAAAAAQQWRQLADEVERRGAVDPAMFDQLRRALGTSTPTMSTASSAG
jgi:hypothetical protein